MSRASTGSRRLRRRAAAGARPRAPSRRLLLLGVGTGETVPRKDASTLAPLLPPPHPALSMAHTARKGRRKRRPSIPPPKFMIALPAVLSTMVERESKAEGLSGDEGSTGFQGRENLHEHRKCDNGDVRVVKLPKEAVAKDWEEG
ncbi:hypothetical protein AXF42_Ash010614 [Apostasia shenzhenica]|uniref:Uncharacterized protein n=1 Tax=Apostasia shenzhenica TaxID=1088818 RepID=A0A2I0A6K5_9ASPA|nr:hypothetical protein AXF42_Ash010614 [Apostasia shenzhenica]